MIARFIPAVLIALAWAPASAHAADARRFDDQVKELAKRLKAAVGNDKIQIGAFNDAERRGTNFGLRIELSLKAELKSCLAESATTKVFGTYNYVTSAKDTAADNPTYKMKVFRIKAVVEDGNGKTLHEEVVEINDTDDKLKMEGATGQPPFNAGQQKRDEYADEKIKNPKFYSKAQTRITAEDHCPYAIEILVKDTAGGMGTPIAPENKGGRAFVDIKQTQYYEIRLYNDDDHEAVASITIDGLDSLNTFNTDGVKYPGYLIPPKSSAVVRGWLHTVKPGAKDSVFSFLVTDYGNGAASQFKKNPGEVGVITVQFSMAWEQGKPPPQGGKRSGGRETAKGDGLPENFKVVPREIGDPKATISVRYSP